MCLVQLALVLTNYNKDIQLLNILKPFGTSPLADNFLSISYIAIPCSARSVASLVLGYILGSHKQLTKPENKTDKDIFGGKPLGDAYFISQTCRLACSMTSAYTTTLYPTPSISHLGPSVQPRTANTK